MWIYGRWGGGKRRWSKEGVSGGHGNTGSWLLGCLLALVAGCTGCWDRESRAGRAAQEALATLNGRAGPRRGRGAGRTRP